MPTVVNSASSGFVNNGNQINFSYSVSAGTNRKLLVIAAGETTGTTPGLSNITYNGVALTSVGQVQNGANVSAIWYLDDASFPSPGSYTVSVTYTTTLQDMIVHVVELSLAAQGTPEASNSSTATSANTLTTTITTLSASAMIIGGISVGDTTAFTASSGQTIAQQNSGGLGGTALATGYQTIVSAGATSMVWTQDATENRLAQYLVSIAHNDGLGIGINTGGVVTGDTTGGIGNITVTGNANRGVIVMVAVELIATYPSAVTVGGASATNIRNESSAVGTGNSTSMWIVTDSQLGSSGSKAISVTWGGGTQAGIVAVEIYNWNQVIPIGSDQNGANAGAVTSISASATAARMASISVEVASHGNNGSPFNSAPTGDVTNRLTTMFNPPSSAYMVTGYAIHSTSGSKSCTESAAVAWNRASMIHAVFNQWYRATDNAAIIGAHF